MRSLRRVMAAIENLETPEVDDVVSLICSFSLRGSTKDSASIALAMLHLLKLTPSRINPAQGQLALQGIKKQIRD